MKRVLPAARSVVYEAFGDPSELAKWWGPEGFTIPSLEFDPRVGESYRIEMQPPEGDSFYLKGEFREVDPPARLAYAFIWEDPHPDDVGTLVALAFRDLLGEATEAALTQGPFKTEARRALHRDGWRDSFDNSSRSCPRRPNQARTHFRIRMKAALGGRVLLSHEGSTRSEGAPSARSR